MEGIALSPKGYRSSTKDCVQGNMLLTPKSVNDTMNTKVQCCWVTPSQPSEAYVDGGEDEKAKVKVGSKNEMVTPVTMVGTSTLLQCFNKPHSRCCEIFFETHDFDPIKKLLASFPHGRLHHPHLPPLWNWVDLVSPSSVELQCSTCIIH